MIRFKKKQTQPNTLELRALKDGQCFRFPGVDSDGSIFVKYRRIDLTSQIKPNHYKTPALNLETGEAVLYYSFVSVVPVSLEATEV